MDVVVLIPAYNPDESLLTLVTSLTEHEFKAIIVINDGSREECRHVFNNIKRLDRVTVLSHAINLGKGAALKTGLNHILCEYADTIGVVTLDADGQHLIEDAVKVAEKLISNPKNLVLGVRAFDINVPLRSKIGNSLTRFFYHLLIGQKISDTQTGLRGIPVDFMPRLLKIDSSGYEYELDMLLACKYDGRAIIEQVIQTVYLEGNKSSHFKPLTDSMKIYFVLFRFTLASLLSALIDNTVFIFVFSLSSSILAGQVTARLVATLYNYTAVRKIVFYSNESKSRTFPRYLSLVCVSGAVSYMLIKALLMFTPLSVIAAKIIVESVVFLANFAIQRDFIFAGNKGSSFTVR